MIVRRQASNLFELFIVVRYQVAPDKLAGILETG